MFSKSFKSNLLTTVGWIAIIGFIAIYIAEFFPKHGPPITIKWIRETFGTTGLIIVNIVIVLAFFALLPYRRSSKSYWKSKGTFVSFVIAVMTEMFGWPLLIFVISPLFDVPLIARDFHHATGHLFATIGTGVSIFGIFLIAVGWSKIHKAKQIVTTGFYKYIRHPQYMGIFLFTLGWILHWPSYVTLSLWPVLIAAYVWLAKKEEEMMEDEFEYEYRKYSKKTKMFIPYIV